MIDTIRTKIMIQRAARGSLCDKWNQVLTPDIEESLKFSFSVSRTWNVSRSSDDVFEVSSNLSITVDLEKRTHFCHLWHIDRVLCDHAIVVTQKFSKDLNAYVDTFLHVEMYHGAYADATCPIPTIDKPNMPLRFFLLYAGNHLGGHLKREFSKGEGPRCLKFSRCGQIGNHTIPFVSLS